MSYCNLRYIIVENKNNTYTFVGYQEPAEDSEGNTYDGYYYILDNNKYPILYKTKEQAENELMKACYDGCYELEDYSIKAYIL